MDSNFVGMGPDKAPGRSIEHETIVEKIDFDSFKEKQALETLCPAMFHRGWSG